MWGGCNVTLSKVDIRDRASMLRDDALNTLLLSISGVSSGILNTSL
jgi:hypothetical protein